MEGLAGVGQVDGQLAFVGAVPVAGDVVDVADMRAVKHGHAPGAAKAIRDARRERTEATVRARYADRYR